MAKKTPEIVTTSSLTLLTSVKAINAAIKDIHDRGALLQMDVHIAACSVIKHLDKHGDIRMVERLIGAMPDMSRVNSMKHWLETFAKVSFSGADGKTLEHPAYVSSKTTRLGEAMEKPFWKFRQTEGTAYVPLVLETYLDNQIKRLKQDQEKAGHTQYTALITFLEDYKHVAPTAH